MPLTLTITDPCDLTEAERFAILTFCQIRVDQRNTDKIAGAVRSEPRDSVREVLTACANVTNAAGVGPFLRAEVVPIRPPADPITADDGSGVIARGEVRIDPADDPSTGAPFVPPVPAAVTTSDLHIPTQQDFSAIFGASVPATPTPPPVPGAPVVPLVPPAPAPGASVPPAGASDALPPAAPPNPTNALDSAGMPWDHRIHATTKTKNADGTWRAKRGVDAKLVADVVDQNRRLMAITPPAVAAAPATMPVAPTGMTFADLMEQVIKLINGGKLSLEGANAACMPIGVTYLHQLDKRPDLIDAAWGHLRAAAGVA